MLQGIDVEKEIKRRVQEFHNIKSEDQKKKAMALIKLGPRESEGDLQSFIRHGLGFAEGTH